MQILRQYELWLRLHPQPHRQAREVILGYGIPLDDDDTPPRKDEDNDVSGAAVGRYKSAWHDERHYTIGVSKLE